MPRPDIPPRKNRGVNRIRESLNLEDTRLRVLCGRRAEGIEGRKNVEALLVNERSFCGLLYADVLLHQINVLEGRWEWLLVTKERGGEETCLDVLCACSRAGFFGEKLAVFLDLLFLVDLVERLVGQAEVARLGWEVESKVLLSQVLLSWGLLSGSLQSALKQSALARVHFVPTEQLWLGVVGHLQFAFLRQVRVEHCWWLQLLLQFELLLGSFLAFLLLVLYERLNFPLYLL